MRLADGGRPSHVEPSQPAWRGWPLRANLTMRTSRLGEAAVMVEAKLISGPNWVVPGERVRPGVRGSKVEPFQNEALGTGWRWGSGRSATVPEPCMLD